MAFLQLIAAQLISAEKVKGKLTWVVCRKKTKAPYPPLRWKDEKNWDGVYLDPEGTQRRYKVLDK